MFSFARNNTIAVCLTSPLNDIRLLNKYQYVEISWQGRKHIYQLSDGNKFMYKMNPFIDAMTPQGTILRYDYYTTITDMNQSYLTQLYPFFPDDGTHA